MKKLFFCTFLALLSIACNRSSDSIDITIKFVSGAFNGFSACNHFNGEYVLMGNSLSLTNFLNNSAFCPFVDTWEDKFQTWLRKTQSFDISENTLQLHCTGYGSLIFKEH